jgi:hypothetical protein
MRLIELDLEYNTVWYNTMGRNYIYTVERECISSWCAIRLRDRFLTNVSDPIDRLTRHIVDCVEDHTIRRGWQLDYFMKRL